MFIKYFKSNLVICIVIFLSIYLVNCPKYLMEIFLSEADQGIYNLLTLPATAVTLIGNFIRNHMLVGISEDYKDNKIKKIKKTVFKMTSIWICCFNRWLLFRTTYNENSLWFRFEFIFN